MEFYLSTPLTDNAVRALSMGDTVYLSGTVYTARDAAHSRLLSLLEAGEEPPFTFDGQVIFYAGPCPAAPGKVIGSIGPTTSGRMDPYAPSLIDFGLRAMIGKGLRSDSVVQAIRAQGGVYFVAIGGAAALMSQCITEAEVIAFPDLGTEAIYKLTVRDLPVIVAVDALGRDIYKR